MKIICTLGPSSFNKNTLNKLKSLGVNIFRINLSHIEKKDILKKIIYLKKNNIKNICIDTEGAQIRTSKVKKKIFFKKNVLIRFSIGSKFSNKNKINLYPNFDLMSCKLNTKIAVGFNSLIFKVKKKDYKLKNLIVSVVVPGYLESNKGVHINQIIKLQPLTEKDEYAIKIANQNKVKFFAISFVHRSSDIDEVRKLVNNKAFIISKIETKSAINELKSITNKSNALLIDRGDLSRYIPIEKIPPAQEEIVKIGKSKNVPVYVATNLLETMIKENQPTRAESQDIFSTLKQGASGLVLAAETAIGINPVGCVKFLKKSISVYRKFKNEKFKKNKFHL